MNPYSSSPKTSAPIRSPPRPFCFISSRSIPFNIHFNITVFSFRFALLLKKWHLFCQGKRFSSCSKSSVLGQFVGGESASPSSNFRVIANHYSRGNPRKRKAQRLFFFFFVSCLGKKKTRQTQYFPIIKKVF